MPLVDVFYDDTVSDAALRRLGSALPDIVAAAVDCPEEPWGGPPAPGDFEIRFRRRSEHDVGGLACIIEVRTKRYASRELDPQRRADFVRDRVLASVALASLGVWLILHDGAWSQS